MSDFIWACFYSLLELTKYILCLIIVFNIPIYKKKYTIPVWIAVSFIICMTFYSIYFFGGVKIFEGIFYGVPDACVLLLLFSFDKNKKLKGILYVILTWIIIDSFSESINQLLTIFSGNKEYLTLSNNLNSFVEKYIVIAVLVLYHLLVNVILRKKVSYSFYAYQWVIIFLFFAGTLMLVITLEGIVGGKEVETTEYITMCICAMLMLFLFIVIMIWQSYVLRKNMSMKEREISYQYMLRSQSEYFDSLMKNDAEMRKLRHDMRAHITALQELATENKDDKVLEYLSGMEVKTNLTNTKRYTGNNAVDAVINELTRQMDENGIEFNFDGIINVREEIKDFDLCTIFYNILMNAIEGCMAVEGADKKTISVKVKNIGDKLGISIENETILEKIPETGILVTTKEDKVNHGFGTMNVKEVVSKYDGIYDNAVVDGKFVADIII